MPARDHCAVSFIMDKDSTPSEAWRFLPGHARDPIHAGRGDIRRSPSPQSLMTLGIAGIGCLGRKATNSLVFAQYIYYLSRILRVYTPAVAHFHTL